MKPTPLMMPPVRRKRTWQPPAGKTPGIPVRVTEQAGNARRRRAARNGWHS